MWWLSVWATLRWLSLYKLALLCSYMFGYKINFTVWYNSTDTSRFMWILTEESWHIWHRLDCKTLFMVINSCSWVTLIITVSSNIKNSYNVAFYFLIWIYHLAWSFVFHIFIKSHQIYMGSNKKHRNISQCFHFEQWARHTDSITLN